jgi:mono/diheme cytochrome c family protein
MAGRLMWKRKMNVTWRYRTLLVALIWAGAAVRASAAQPPDRLTAEVREAFAAKCARCHSEQLAKPRGDFGYVTDLRRLSGDHDLVVPFDAGQSKLWAMIESGKMPPKASKDGPLSNSQKALVRWWIELGAPADTAGPGVAATRPNPPQAPESILRHSLEWIGRFHVLVIHFPIALLVAAALAEAWGMWVGRAGMSPAVRYCVLLGAAGAVVAAALGWVRAPFSGYAGGSDLLFLHRWAGTAAGVCALIAAGAVEYDVGKRHRTRLSRAALFGSAILVGLAGHLGGSLVYGTGYFNW